MKVRRSANRLYMIFLETCKPVCLRISAEELAWCWHARLGHINFHSLKSMANKEMVVGLPKIDHPVQICEACLVAKQARSPLLSQTQFRASRPLELAHADLCGPISPLTDAGN